MHIHRAVKKALKKNKLIRRKNKKWAGFVVRPTNSRDCCYIICLNNKERQPGRCWNPTAEDLIADDWEVTKE